MDCPHARNLLDPFVDGELGASDKSDVETHLAHCPACREAFDEHGALGTAIRRSAAYHRAPHALLARVRESVAEPSRASAAPRWRMPRWFQLGAAAAAGAVVAVALTLQLNDLGSDEALVSQVVSAHARAVLTAHQLDVVSSDRHAVKPWLSARLDFSPRVVELVDSGFPLRGARVDYVDNRPVAVLVYAHREHVIDVYVWPSAQAPRERAFTKNGYNLARWNDADMTYWALSDLNAADLKSFVAKLAAAR